MESNYLQMKKYLSDNKSNLELTITNARLERENNSLKSENKLLKAVINNISDFIEKVSGCPDMVMLIAQTDKPIKAVFF